MLFRILGEPCTCVFGCRVAVRWWVTKIVDLLREVKYDRTSQGQVYFEPQHIQYIPVRREVMDIIEVQVADTIRNWRRFS